MTLGDLLEAFARAGVARQQYEDARAQLRKVVRARRRDQAQRLAHQVASLALLAYELETAAERMLPGISMLH